MVHPTVMYRYDAQYRFDRWGSIEGVEIKLREFSVVKRTLCGVWIRDPWRYKERWVSLGTRKAFAYDTKEKALASMRIRNVLYIRHLRDDLQKAELAREALKTPDLYLPVPQHIAEEVVLYD